MPKIPVPGCIWFGDNPKQGVAVVVGPSYRVAPIQERANVPKFLVPFKITGPNSFILFAVWTLGKQPFRYVRAAVSAMDIYDDLLITEPVVLLGDFNSNLIWDKLHPKHLNHSSLVDRLQSRGLTSAYHHARSVAHGQEQEATFHLYRHKERPYHIDYCFLPLLWAHRISSLHVGAYETWIKHSDHLPLIVDLDLGVA